MSLIAGMSVMMGKSAIESVQRGQTQQKLDVIERALVAFRTLNDRLPCPANGALATTDANYGVEAANKGSCTGGTPAANFGPSSGTVEGAVPFKALNLTEEFMYDGWGRKIGYAVQQAVTATDGMSSIGWACTGGITVKDAAGGDRSKGALYALIGYGEDGHGAFLRGGARHGTGSTNADQQQNCNCDASAAATAYDATYVQKEGAYASATDQFDDSVRYKERWQMQTTDDLTPFPCNFRIDGVAASEWSGTAISAGDVNGDGYADIIIGAYLASPGGTSNAGSTYVVFGKASGFPNPLPLSSLDGANGFRLDGVAASDTSGNAVAAGDVNKDGFADVIVAANQADPGGLSSAGSVYVVFGKAAGWAATTNLSTLDGATGFRLDGVAAWDYSGQSVSAGDINGDEFADVIVGASGADPGGLGAAGSTYVVFGKAAGWAASMSLSTLNGATGFRLDGVAAGDASGESVSAGNINGDGFADVIVGAYGADPGGVSVAGSTYVVFGKAAGWAASTSLSTLDGATGFRLDGVAAGDSSGFALSAGDVNNDGFADVVIGAYNADPGGVSNAGSTYVVFGKAAGWAASMSLSTLDGATGFRLDGVAASDISGYAVRADDVNNDGYADVVVGAGGGDPGGVSAAGSTYVYFGKASGYPATFDLGDI